MNIEKPPGVTSTERIFIDFLLPDAPERYNQPEQLNYIIFQASRQGVYFLYLFLEVLYEKSRYLRPGLHPGTGR